MLSPSKYKPNSFAIFVIILLSCLHEVKIVSSAVHSVLTYKQSSTQLGQLVTSSTLLWETYNASPKQLEFAIQGGKYTTEEEHYPIYVCRVNVEGVYTSGYTEKQAQKHLCVVSYLKQVKIHKNFDLLMNKEYLGQVSWKTWNKFSPSTPIGAVTIGDHYFVARHPVKKNLVNEDSGADYSVGRLDTTIGLGKILVIEGNTENEYTEGEVLVEMDPFRYELHDIALNKTKMNIDVNTTELSNAILSNEGDKVGLIETVMSYCYDKKQYWGTHDGVAKGLLTKIFELNTPTSEVYWAILYSEKRCETKTVSTNLYPGTALNVTLKGNFTTLKSPYSAKLMAYYLNSQKTLSRTITSVVKKDDLTDVKLEFSPVYWLNNGTIIPTTTTTTTTEATQNTKDDPKPIHEPPTVYLSDLSKSVSSAFPSSKESSSAVLNDDENNIIPKNAKENYAENLQHKTNNVAATSDSILLLVEKRIICLTLFGFLLLH